MDIEKRPIQTGDRIVVLPVFDGPISIEEYVHIDDTHYSGEEYQDDYFVRMDDYDVPQDADISGGRPGFKIFLRIQG